MTFWAACLECRLQRPKDAMKRLLALVAEGQWLNPDRLRDDEDLMPLRDAPGWEQLLSTCEGRRASEQAQLVPEILMEPAKTVGEGPPPLLVALHMRSGNIAEARANWHAVTEMGWSLALPQGSVLLGPHEYGWASHTAEQIGRQLEELKSRRVFDSTQVIFGGASQGAVHAVKMALSGEPLRSPGFIAVAGAPRLESIQSMIMAAREAGVGGVFIVGDQDFALAGVRQVCESLESAGLEVQLHIVPGLGHQYPAEIDEYLRRAIDFIRR